MNHLKESTYSKIVGFTLSRHEVDHSQVDVFGVGLNVLHIFHAGINLYLWGIGDLEKCKIDDSFCLSFPLSKRLDDRNVLISQNHEGFTISNDWLGSIPVFYNADAHIVSTRPNLVARNRVVDNEGLELFLRFGYSVFGRTIFKDVRFLQANTDLVFGERVFVKDRLDPALSWEPNSTTPELCLDILKHSVEEIYRQTPDSTTILPLSGGYDSRILAYLLPNRQRCASFSYGNHLDVNQCVQTVYAKTVAKRLGIDWHAVPLGDFFQYTDEWYKIYGFSTHLHGMYQIEFYKKILRNHAFSNPLLLSGIVGDAWAGSMAFGTLTKPSELYATAYAHGTCIEPRRFSSNSLNSGTVVNRQFEKYQATYARPQLRPLVIIRNKIMLLSYLLTTCETMGIPCVTPFLNQDVVRSMLCLPEAERRKRLWQTRFFSKVNLDVEIEGHATVDHNQVMEQAFRLHVFDPLEVSTLKPFIKESFLKSINKRISDNGFYAKVINKIQSTKYGEKILRRVFGIKKGYVEYMVLKSIEKSLSRS